ncbi:pirin family protein [Neisseriaceae bacterium PsAf]|nr:pirin family protein [Neisseriaceae bacterium PsAf]
MSKIKKILPATLPLPVSDPFIFTMHHEDFYPRGDGHMGPVSRSDEGSKWRMYYGETVPGFPVHPHRGFETITVVDTGFVDHTDGLGSMGRYGDGDVQWMTAGKGLQHAEMFPLVHDDKENTLNLFQIWLNLPQKNKMVDANYKMVWNEQIPVIEQENKEGAKTLIRVISGSFEGTQAPSPTSDSWANNPDNHVGIFMITLESNASVTIPKISESLTRMVYIFKGKELNIEGEIITSQDFVYLDGNQEINLLNTGDETIRFILIEGEPINEPIAAYGPFVMNTREEIMQAYNDFSLTQFGGWPHPVPDPVSEKDSGRYARYPDGSIEYPPQLS